MPDADRQLLETELRIPVLSSYQAAQAGTQKLPARALPACAGMTNMDVAVTHLRKAQ